MDNMVHQAMDIFRFALHLMADQLFKLLPTDLIGAMKAVAILFVIGIVVGFLDHVTENRGGDPQAGSN